MLIYLNMAKKAKKIKTGKGVRLSVVNPDAAGIETWNENEIFKTVICYLFYAPKEYKINKSIIQVLSVYLCALCVL
jgi:hypothetical protein